MIDLRTELELLITRCRADGVSSAAEVGHVLALFEERGLRLVSKDMWDHPVTPWKRLRMYPGAEGGEDG